MKKVILITMLALMLGCEGSGGGGGGGDGGDGGGGGGGGGDNNNPPSAPTELTARFTETFYCCDGLNHDNHISPFCPDCSDVTNQTVFKWVDNSDDETGFILTAITRNPTSDPPEERYVFNLPADSVSYSMQWTEDCDSRTRWFVQAKNDYGLSEKSNEFVTTVAEMLAWCKAHP